MRTAARRATRKSKSYKEIRKTAYRQKHGLFDGLKIDLSQ